MVNINQNKIVKENSSAYPAAGFPITVFFPCYNEQDNVEKTTKKTVEVLENIKADYEIIIVNDGSADNTKQIAESLAQGNNRIKVINHAVNRGYGGALQSGYRAASKKYVFYTDGDGQFDISEMPSLIHLMDQFDIVTCYRLDRKDNISRKLNAFAWTKLVCFLFKMKIRDIDCAFKLFKTDIFKNIDMVSNGALIDTEVLARATKAGYKITQVGVHHFPRTAGTQTGANFKVILRAFSELFKLYREIKNTSPRQS